MLQSPSLGIKDYAGIIGATRASHDMSRVGRDGQTPDLNTRRLSLFHNRIHSRGVLPLAPQAPRLIYT